MDFSHLLNWTQDHLLTVVAIATTLVLIYHYLIEKDKGVKLSQKYRSSIFEAQSKIFLNAVQFATIGYFLKVLFHLC